MSSWLIWVRLKIERESWVLISVYGQGSERSEEIEHVNEVIEGIVGRNESARKK